MIYCDLTSYLKAGKIELRDRKGKPLTEQEAQHRLVETISASKQHADTLVITIL